jgi:predicted nucleotidyltransferase component of viral defense system
MLELEQIKKQYPPQLQGFDRAILREYLQYKILQAIFESKQASQVSFLGSTALRIVYGNARFSEDIDLDNFGLSWQNFADMLQKVGRFLELEGFEVELNQVSRDAYHCYFRFPELLYARGLSPHQQEKILIQVDTAAQGYAYEPQLIILNKFDVFSQVRVTPLNVLLSQKIFTAVNRKRAKGRDFYDITFLFGKTKPDYGFLEQKMGIRNPVELRESLLHKIEGYDFEALASEVAPFLISQDQARRVQLFREFWQQVPLE